MAGCLLFGYWANPVVGQDDQLVKALNIQPKHSKELDIEMPPNSELGEYRFARVQSPSGFVVHHESGRMLRRFVDTNGDGKLDRWSYFRDGLEVYRDIDSDFDGTDDALSIGVWLRLVSSTIVD